MLRVALTGGIATGKSYVVARFRERGVPVIEADALVHQALVPGTGVSARVVERFGPGILDESGAIDRRRLGAIVFHDAGARQDLEALIHPAVYRAIEGWFAAERAEGRARWAVADIPLLYETGHEHEFDKVVVTACRPEQQVARITGRDLIPEDEACARLAAQWTIDEKARRADFVIRTDGTFADTDRQIDEVCARLNQLAGGI